MLTPMLTSDIEQKATVALRTYKSENIRFNFLSSVKLEMKSGFFCTHLIHLA